MMKLISSIFFSAHLFLGCAALSLFALFSFLETSITALRLFKLKELAKSIKGYRQLFDVLEQRPHRVLITILIASTCANVTCAALFTDLVSELLAFLHVPQGLAFSLSVGITTVVMLIFGEVLPKNIAKIHGERMFRYGLWIINSLFYLLYPIAQILGYMIDGVLSRAGGAQHDDRGATENEVRFLIDYTDEKGLMEPEKTGMLKNIFRLERTPVKEIMVPAVSIISIEAHTTINDALLLFSKHLYSRLPVYVDRPDNVIGIIYQKDVFVALSLNQGEKLIEEIVRPVLFVPESVRSNQVLREFRHKQKHMAMVLNEFGGIAGLVTLEDVIEEIVGDIADENELVPAKIIALHEGSWLVDAGISLEELSKTIPVTLESKDSVTLGGFLSEQLQHVPKKGEQIMYGDFCFQVQQAESKRVNQVLVSQTK